MIREVAEKLLAAQRHRREHPLSAKEKARVMAEIQASGVRVEEPPPGARIVVTEPPHT